MGSGPSSQTLGSLFSGHEHILCVTLGKALNFQSLSFFICKMGILVPTSQGCYKENLLSVKALFPCKLWSLPWPLLPPLQLYLGLWNLLASIL